MSVSDQQLTALLEYCTEFARRMLEEEGEFYPFGAEITASGELVALGFWDGQERPSSQELYAYAQNALRQKAASAEILGAAIAAHVNIPPEFNAAFPDGVRVHVESENFCRLIYIPYAVRQSGLLGRRRSLEYADMFGVDIPPILYAASS